MKSDSFIPWIFVCSFAVSPALGDSLDASPKEVLASAAKKFGDAKTIYAKSSQQKAEGKGSIELRMYQSKGPDDFVSQRSEIIRRTPKGKQQEFIAIKTIRGSFFLKKGGKKAVEISRMTNANSDFLGNTELIGDLADTSSLDMSSDTVDGVEVWSVKQKLNERFAEIAEATLENSNAGGRLNKRKIPALVIYKIEKKTRLLRGKEIYNNDGDKIESVFFDTVKIDVPVDPKIFEIPPDLVLLRPSSDDEFVRMLMEAIE